jgi:mannosyl-oligosaccharide alpha-1,2-mannosidase
MAPSSRIPHLAPGNGGDAKRRVSDGDKPRDWPYVSFLTSSQLQKLVHTLRANLYGLRRRWVVAFLALALVWLIALRPKTRPAIADSERRARASSPVDSNTVWHPPRRAAIPEVDKTKFPWRTVPQQYPLAVGQLVRLPSLSPQLIPRIQHSFNPAREPAEPRAWRVDQLAQIKANFTHAWTSYRNRAWGRDELSPLSGGGADSLGGWAATAIESLDTLWLMGMKTEFEATVNALVGLEFGAQTLSSNGRWLRLGDGEVDVFELTTRILGGLLSAFEISGLRYPTLLRKAIELGDMLLVAFDTPSHMPVSPWNLRRAKAGRAYQVADDTATGEMAAVMLEFTKLSQLTGDGRYFNAIAQVVDRLAEDQDRSQMAGLWPATTSRPPDREYHEQTFDIAGRLGAAYDALPKMFLLLDGGRAALTFRDMYVKALASLDRQVFYRPMTNGDIDILLAGEAVASGTITRTEPHVRHSSCLAGGMVALASRTFDLDHDMNTARRLLGGCLWAYGNSPGGLAAEAFRTVACSSDAKESCSWNETAWLDEVKLRDDDEAEMIQGKLYRLRLTPGFTAWADTRHLLGPETISSLFTLYRLTGDEVLREWGWRLFETVVRYTSTVYGHASLDDVTAGHPGLSKTDAMDSWWLGGTLKLFWLLFEDPDALSLDEWLLNSKGHAMRWRERAS